MEKKRVRHVGRNFHQLASNLLLVITFAVVSFSSPLYTSNPWVDTNAMFTMGRAWNAGMVPFRDLFEQRGPSMYFLYSLAARISSTNFLEYF